MINPTGGANWPKDIHGQPMTTAKDPATGIMMCQACWSGCHPRTGCTHTDCQCRCYKGRIRSTTGLRKPTEGQESIPESVGTIEIT